MGGNKVRCDTVCFGNALQGGMLRLHFPWGQFGPIVDSAPSFMNISGIHWGVMRTELGAKTLGPTTFLVFTKVARSGRSVNSLQRPQFCGFLSLLPYL